MKHPPHQGNPRTWVKEIFVDALRADGRTGFKLVLLSLLFMGILAVQWSSLRPAALKSQLDRLGLEYGAIAASVMAGQGFANPFGYMSGPTAWMPPGVVAVYILVFWVWGIKTYAAACALLLLKAAALTLAVGVLLQTVRAWDLSSYWRGLAVISVIAIFGRFDWLGLLDLDESLLILVSVLSLLCLAQLRQRRRPWHYLLMAALPLISPPLALGVGLVLVRRALKREQRAGLWLLLMMIMSVGGWTVRNRIVMGRVLPVKSNLWFEFFLSNPASPNGLLSTETLVREHPIHPENKAQMASVGEIETCEAYANTSKAWLRQHPDRFALNVAARAYSVFVRSYSGGYFRTTRRPVTPEDATVLQRADLLWVHRSHPTLQFWLYPELPEAEAMSMLQPLDLQNRQEAWQSWSLQMADRRAFENQPGRVAQAIFYSLLPTLAILIGLIRGGWRWPAFSEAVLLYLAYFLPYILVSYTQRYQISALGLQIWLVWLFLLPAAARLKEPSIPLES